ncbi:MAG: hypothetical protein V4469_03875 [Patescibacteria group bacterium]
MLFPFLKSQNQNKSYAIFCIDGIGITFSVIEKTLDNKEHISHITKLSLDITVQRDADKMLREINSKMDQIFEGLKKEHLFDVIKPNTEIVILVGSPWHIGWVDQVKLEKENPFKVTKKLIDESIDGSFTAVHKDLEITNISIMSYKLNGYLSKNPLDKVTKSFNLSVYISSAPKTFTEMVRNIFSQRLPHNKVSFFAYNTALFEAIQNTTGKTSCLVVIPEIETTELILIKDNIVTSEASVPFGGAVLARTLFGAKSAGLKESLLKTKRFVEGTLDISELEQVGVRAKKMKEDFLGQFRDVVWKMSDTLVLPGDIFVVGRNLATHFVFDWINSDEYIKNTFTIDEYKVMNLRGNDMISQQNLTGLFRHKSIPVGVAVSTQFVVKKTNQ